MEKRITSKVDSYIGDFKNDVKEWFESNNFNKSDFLKFVFDYENLSLGKDDFVKRKRSKNVVPTDTRCCGRRADGEQCTRKKKDGCEFCGTHVKGTPYGIVKTEVDAGPKINKKTIWVQEIEGINYFVDSENNVYLHSEVMGNKVNPRIVGKVDEVENKRIFTAC